jgi:hypothetical protein
LMRSKGAWWINTTHCFHVRRRGSWRRTLFTHLWKSLWRIQWIIGKLVIRISDWH